MPVQLEMFTLYCQWPTHTGPKAEVSKRRYDPYRMVDVPICSTCDWYATSKG